MSTTYPTQSTATPGWRRRDERGRREEGERGRQGGNASCLVEIQVSGNRPPLFWAHGISGSTSTYRPIARLLAGRRDVYGLENRTANPSNRLAESARRFAAAINERRPDGPCEILGYSLGGLVALETARQLVMTGREVTLVGILDTAPPTVPVAPENTSVALSLISRGLGLRPPFDPATIGTDPELIAMLSVRAVEARILPASLAFDYVSAMARTYTANGQAADRYRPRAYRGRAAVLLTRDGDALRHLDLWRRFAPGIYRTDILDLDHFSLIGDAAPTVHAVIDEWLTR
ncbi:thioesterase domain-containing protein [Micromonospora sp. NPDC005203]|uniref:thioesterase domain-containing protein n=1 Tax=Micromonospora sp. NPDC005203 TaxID=3364226 RepID=UPI0036BBE592